MAVPHLFFTSRSHQELGLFVKDAVARDGELLPLHRASYLTLGLRMLPMDRGVFLRSPSDLHSLIHHACVPAAYIDWHSLCVRALRRFKESEEITLNYMTIYEAIAAPFVCHCGAEGCYGEVAGFNYLPLETKLKLELHLSPHLKSQLNRDAMAAKAQAS
jgi:hypothetical protein